jgi:tRNA(Ile2) C34 agmatinyltransferase TiaS
MEHPFINQAELKEKTLEELQETISGLTNKLSFAYRTGNGALIHQLHMAIDTYRTQHSKKMDAIFDKQKIANKINISSDNELKN